MSVVTAVAPALDLDGPLPVAPQHNLLSIPGVLVEDDGRWLSGVNLYPYPSDVPYTFDPCSAGTFRDKEIGADVENLRFDAFGLYLPITCNAKNIGAWQDFAARAEEALQATIAYGVEKELVGGEALEFNTNGPNPYLGDSSVTVVGGGAVRPEVGLSWLEHEIALTGREGMIHAPPEVVAAWGFNYLKEDGNGVLRTANGTPVVSGAGYVGASANGSAPGSGNSYAFASGPVEVRLGETTLVGDDIKGTLDTSNNVVTFRAEIDALVTWDGVLQAAVLIDWTP